MLRSFFRTLVLLTACTPLCAQTTFAPPVFGKGPVPFALLRQSWMEDFEAGRLLASIGHYAPDANLLRLNSFHAEGLPAIRQTFSAIFERFDCSVKLTSRVTSESGDLAYDSGSFTESLVDHTTHQALASRGEYLTIYRHFGLQWLIVQQAFLQAQDAPSSPAGVPTR